jgi:hypothetical protein
MKKERFPNIKIEIKAEGLAKKILGKPAASTPSVYGEEQPEGKNLPNVSIKGKNQELQALLETSNKKPVYTGLVKQALTELRLQKATGDDPGADAAAEAARQQKISEQGFAPTSSVDSSMAGRNPLVGSTSAMDEGAPTETGTRRMGTAPSPMDEGASSPLTQSDAVKRSKISGGFGSFRPAGQQAAEFISEAPDFDMAAGAKASSMPAEVNQAPSPEDMGTSGPGPTKYVGNLQIPSNIASQGQDAIDEFVKRATTAGDGLMQNNMEKAPAPAGNPMRDVAAQAVAHFVAPTSPKPVTKMNTQELVKEAVFEIRKDNGVDYKFGDLLLDGLAAGVAKKAGGAVISNLDKIGSGLNALSDNLDPEIKAAKKDKTSLPNWLKDKIQREVDIVRTNQPAGQQAVTFKDKKKVTDFKALTNIIGAGGNKVKDFTKKLITGFGGISPKGTYGTLVGKPGPKTKLGIIAGVIYGGLNYGDDLAKKVGVDKDTVNTVKNTVLGTLDFLNPLRDGGGFSIGANSQRFTDAGNKVLQAVYSSPEPVTKNIQKAPMVGGAAGQMPKATTMNRPANMGVNVQQPVITGAGTMKNIEKRVAANKPKAVGAPKKTRATKRKGR